MEHALDLDTGHVLRPADVPAYLRHPAIAGRLVRVMGVASFSPPTASPLVADGERPDALPCPRASSPITDRRN